MATKAIKGGAAALPTLPPIRKGRVRKAEGVFTGGGELALSALVRDGEAIPANVERLKPLPEPSPIHSSPELMLILLVFAELPRDRQDTLKQTLAIHAEAGRCPHAAALCGMFERGRGHGN